MALAEFLNGAGKSVQQLLLERQLEAMGVSPAQLAQRNQARQDQELQLRQREMGLRGREFDQNQQRLNQNATALDQSRIANEGDKAAEAIPANSILSPTDTGASKIQAAGLGGLLSKNTTLPSTQMTGTGSPGSLLTRSMPTDNVVQSLTKLPTEKQQTAVQAERDRQTAAEDRRIAHDDAMANTRAAQESTNAFRTATLGQGQQRIDQGQERIDGPSQRKQWVMRNGKPVFAEPSDGDQPYSASTGDLRKQWVTRNGQLVYDVPGPGDTPRPGATVENRLSSAEAVQQTGNDIIKQISDPKVKAMLGPVLGRYNNLQEFIGSPPPEFADLAGTIESYALANMGVHGMRSVEGSNQIKALLSAKHTPESLAAAIQGLSRFSQHYMQNNGKTPAGGGDTTAAPGKRIVYDINGKPVQ